MENLFANQRWLIASLGVTGLLIAGIIVGINLFVGHAKVRVIPAGSAVPVEIEALPIGSTEAALRLTSMTDHPDSSPFLLIGRDSTLRPDDAADFCLLGSQANPLISSRSTFQNVAGASAYYLVNADHHDLTLSTTGLLSSATEGQAIPLTYCPPSTPKQAQFYINAASM